VGGGRITPVAPDAAASLASLQVASVAEKTEVVGRAAGKLTCRHVALGSLSDLDLDRWRDLADHALEPNPFFEPELLLAARRHLGEREATLLVVEDLHAWRACLPVSRQRINGMAVTASWLHLYSFLGTPLLCGDAPDAAARMLLANGCEGNPLSLRRLGADGPAAAALRLAAADLGLTTIFESRSDRALLRRRSDGSYLDAMRGHRRRELNRMGRALARELGAELEVVDETATPGAVEAFLELERSGWKGQRQTALASDDDHADFFTSICAALSEQGRLELLCLRAGDRRVAMKCNIYAGEGGFCFKIAYDEQLARFSPGVQLERENVRVFAENRHERWQDSCADQENTMINRLWPDRRPLTTVVLARPGPRATAFRHLVRAARTVRAKRRRNA